MRYFFRMSFLQTFHSHYASTNRGPELKTQLDIIKKQLEEKEKLLKVEKKRVERIEKDLANSKEETMNATLNLSKRESEIMEIEKTAIATTQQLADTKQKLLELEKRETEAVMKLSVAENLIARMEESIDNTNKKLKNADEMLGQFATYKVDQTYKQSTYQIVVSRYNEDIQWTKQFNNVLIYNKGGALEDLHFKLYNVGRESHTFYYHICNNYNKLADYTIFLQGAPFDHSPNLVKNIKKFMKKTNIDFAFLSENIKKCNLNQCPHHPTPLPLKSTYKKIFGKEAETDFTFGAGAQFIVSKEAIRRRSLKFYTNIVKMLEYSVHPVEGYCLERFHKLIFT